jgi:hypothetical protein
MEKDPFSQPPQTEHTLMQTVQNEVPGTDFKFDIEQQLLDPATLVAAGDASGPGFEDEQGTATSEPIDKLTGKHRNSSVHIDRGSIELKPLIDAVDTSRIAYHGIRESLAKVRVRRAVDRINKMDHKNEMYKAHSEQALGTATAATPNIQPVTLPEKNVTRRQKKRQHKAFLNMLDSNIVNGGYQSKPYKNGVSKIDKRLQKFDIKLSDKDRLTKREELHKVDSTVTDKKSQFRKTSGEKRRLAKSARQPILSRWRGMRQHLAEGTVRIASESAKKQKTKKTDLEKLRTP